MARRLLPIALLLLALAGCTAVQPTAVITASPLFGAAPLTVNFDGSASHGDIAQYNWSFGDASNPVSGARAAHVYTRPGIYTAKLTIVDKNGNVSSTQALITVINPPPVAIFFISNDSPYIGRTVKFDASRSHDNGAIVKYEWLFGDGAMGEGMKVSHIYTRTGYFIVRLTVMDNLGATASIRHGVTVKKLPGGCPT